MCIDDVTGYCFPSGDVDALADSIAKIAAMSPERIAEMAAVRACMRSCVSTLER